MVRVLTILLVALTYAALGNGNKCPPPEGIMPCRCRDRNDQIQVWCSHSDLERVNGTLENLMRLRNLPAIDELIVENNRMPTLPARAFGSLQIGRLLLRHNGLESISRNAFAGLENSIQELYIVEDKLSDFPFDAIEQLQNLEAFTVERSKIRLIPKFNGLNNLKHIRIDGSLISSLPVGAFAQMAELKQIHLVNSKLTALSDGIFGRLENLLLANFSGNRIEIIQPKSFALLYRVEVLSLVNNRLEDAPSIGKACEQLPSLKSLDLSNNKLKLIPENSFINLKTLQMLNLGFNSIESMSPGSITHLQALRKVDLSGNELRNFPRTLFQGTPLLEELKMQRNLLSTPSEITQILSSLKSLRSLDLSGNGITALPSGTITNHTQLQTMDLSDNRITRIEIGAFSRMISLGELSLRNNSLTNLPSDESLAIPSLKDLDLSSNKLQNIQKSMLSGLSGLLRLDASYNNIKSIGQSTFTHNKDLQELDLSDNIISLIAEDGFRGLSKLVELDLGRNHLENLPNGMLLTLSKLRKLNLSNNRINGLPTPLFTDTTTLEELNLKSNAINLIQPNLFTPLEYLKELNLKFNSLSTITNGYFTGLKNLETLKLASNKITRFDEAAFDSLPKLRTIDLNSNRIVKIPSNSFQNLPNLERFEGRENRISSLETDFRGSSRMEVLDLAHNALKGISRSVVKPSLRVLDFSHNMIERISADDFKVGGSSLTEVYLNHNRIKDLAALTFSNLTTLTILDLDGNELNTINPFTFSNLPKLIYLRISRNKLRAIEKQAFSNLNALDGLDLQENELETISEQGFQATNSLKYLNLSHNNFDSFARMGLFPLFSLEVLDVSFNRIREVDKTLAHLQWLVELRLNDNGICQFPTSLFDGMSRLKMLLLRNNFLSHLSETVFYKLRNNIAFVDVSGNPINCDCELIWLRNLLAKESIQELTDSTCDSPNELKGQLVKDIRPGRMVCRASRGLKNTGVADCPTLLASKRRPRPILKYDDDKPLFGSSSDLEGSSSKRGKDEKILESNDYGSSDTPTIYASSNSNSNQGKKSTNPTETLSGLSTLFGFPLPTLDFGLNLGISPSVSISDKDSSNHIPPSWADKKNVYEQPEYIPRKPIQPYIPLNPFAESQSNLNVVPIGKNNFKQIGNRGQGQQTTSKPIRFPTNPAAAAPPSAWHPNYPNTETGFIPIEPFFHGKNPKPNNVVVKSTDPRINARLTTSTTSSSTTPIPPVSQEYPIEEDVSYTPVYIKEDEDDDEDSSDSLSDFWNMFNNTEAGERDESTINIPIPFNFSSPIDTADYGEPNPNEIPNSFSSSNQIPFEAGGDASRRPFPSGKSTITKLRHEEVEMSSNSIQSPKASAPPVLIGEKGEPLDWYYTSYNNPPNPGEEIEKYLERNRATRVEDIIVSMPSSSSYRSSTNRVYLLISMGLLYYIIL